VPSSDQPTPFKPFLERGTGKDRVRAGEQRTALVELAIGVCRVGHLLDLQRVSPMGGEQGRRRGEVLLLRTGDLRVRRPGPLRLRGQIGESLSDGSGGDGLRATFAAL
jgi:hypothetical protein